MTSMPGGLPQAVHAALRRWHGGGQEALPWQEMLVIARHLAQQPAPNLDLAIKEVVMKALNALEATPRLEDSSVLRLRFLDGFTAAETAGRLNLTQNIVYKRQREAIEALAALVWQGEQEARAARMDRILKRLESRHQEQLFGVDEKSAELLAVLTSPEPPWMLALVGIGGVGKTSLADAAVRALATSPRFADIAWVSARQDRFTPWSGLQPGAEGLPALSFEDLLGAVVKQFDFGDLARLSWEQQLAGLRARFRQRPYLVVVDNLETAADYRALIPNLQGLVDPGRFLLTCRRSLHDFPGVRSLRLDELSEADSLALLRHQARERGIDGIATAPDEALRQVYDAAGGNPLALKLLVGQMHSLSLPRVVEDLREARGRSVEDLYRHIYWRSWNLLDEAARRVLVVMPLVAEEGGRLSQVAAVSGVGGDRLGDALKQLDTLCLLNIGGTLQDRRYSIHRLTESFLLNEVVKWQAAS
ncbi:MAG: NB-ARC domain-containing protein [Anaerolineae bacterium]|jgi:hypothetical protein